MAAINPYLTFIDNCEEAFEFYKSVFGGEYQHIGRFKEMPPIDGKTVPAWEAEKIMHVSLPISKETILMGSDSSETFGPLPVAGTNFNISINTGSEAEANKIFNGISAGGKIVLPMGKTFWESYFGMCVDKFGISWMVRYEYNKK